MRTCSGSRSSTPRKVLIAHLVITSCSNAPRPELVCTAMAKPRSGASMRTPCWPIAAPPWYWIVTPPTSRRNHATPTARSLSAAVSRAPVPEMEPGVGQELAYVRDHSADGGRRARERPRPGDPWLLVHDHVSDRHAVRDRLVCVEAALGHAKRDEQELADRGLEGLAGRDLDEPAEDGEARVRVVPDLANRRELLELGHRRDVPGERVVALAEVREAVAEPAAGVGDEMAEGHASRRVLVAQAELRQVPADRRVQIERATFDQAHHDRRRHRLRDRRDLKERVAVHWKWMLDAGDAVRRDVLVALMKDADRDTGDVVAGHPIPHKLLELRPHARIVARA